MFVEYKDVVYDYEPHIDVTKTKQKFLSSSKNKKWKKYYKEEIENCEAIIHKHFLLNQEVFENLAKRYEYNIVEADDPPSNYYPYMKKPFSYWMQKSKEQFLGDCLSRIKHPGFFFRSVPKRPNSYFASSNFGRPKRTRKRRTSKRRTSKRRTSKRRTSKR